MDMTEADRALIAQRVQAQRSVQFGTRSAAYRAAGLNSGTWGRIEAGLVVREDRMIAAVKTLWPSTGGDWRKVPDVAQGAQSAVGSEQWLIDLQNRVEALERIVTDGADQESDSHGRKSSATSAADVEIVEAFDVGGEVTTEALDQQPGSAPRRRSRGG